MWPAKQMSSLYYLSIQFPCIMDSRQTTHFVCKPATLSFRHFCLCFLQSSHDNYRTLVPCYGSDINVYVAMLQFTSVERMYFGNTTLQLIPGGRKCLLVLCKVKINGCYVLLFDREKKTAVGVCSYLPPPPPPAVRGTKQIQTS
jgi:hypothetical protein